MSVEENKALVRRWFEEAHHGNLDVDDEILAPEFVTYTNAMERFESKGTPESHKKSIQQFLDSFPDGRWSIGHIVAEGDRVAVQVTFTGTHTGPWGDIPPTNKKGKITQHLFLRIVDGKIVEMENPSGVFRYGRALLDGTLFKEQEEAQSK